MSSETAVAGTGARVAGVSVLVVESNPLLRLGLRTVMEAAVGMRCVGEAGTAAALTELTRRTRPDVVLVQARLLVPGQRDPMPRRILAGLADGARPGRAETDHLIVVSPQAGPLGRVERSAAPDELVGDVLALWARCPARRRRPEAVRTDGAGLGITRRELEVLGLFADGLSNKQVAQRLAVSETTVRFHSKNILRKLSAVTRSQAVFKAVRAGMLVGG